MSSPAAREAREAAHALARRLAVAAALLVAFVSTLRHAPLWLASLRGVATLIVLGLVARAGTAALARAIDLDRESAKQREGARS